MDDCSDSSSSTFFEGSSSGEDTEPINAWVSGVIVENTAGIHNQESPNSSLRNSIGSVETIYAESYFDIGDNQDVDVVDGQDQDSCLVSINITQSRTYNDDDLVPSTSTNTFSYLSAPVGLPPSATHSEHVACVSQWVQDSSPTADVEGDDTSRRTTAIDYIEKLINLCAEKLDKCPLFLSTVGSVSLFENDSDTAFQLIVTLLESNYITEGLMRIIDLIWSSCANNDGNPNHNANSKSREVMLMVLNCASSRPARLYQVVIEKILSHNIFRNEDEEYFQHVSLCTNIKTPSKEFTIFQRIETWINNALQLSSECETAVLDLDICLILEVIMDVNRERNLNLSPEEQSRYAAKAQRVLREIFFSRCHSFLKSQGFVFEVISSQRPENRDMAYYLPPTNDRMVPNGQPMSGSQFGGNRYHVDAWLRNELAEAVYALANDEQLNANAWNSNGGGSSPPHLSGSGGNSQGSGGSLREGAIDLDEAQWRLSQESMHSRMNQGYTSSQSLSQGSLPRMSNSQGSTNSAMVRFITLDNEYILENQYNSSSPESSQEPAWKRIRFSNSQQ